MNSGTNIYISFRNKNFLHEVLNALKNTTEDGSGKNLYINISKCKIGDNANVLDNLTVL